MNFPQNLKYTNEHEWIRVEGDIAYVGITDYAQDVYKRQASSPVLLFHTVTFQ